jgi:hypothetical protein
VSAEAPGTPAGGGAGDAARRPGGAAARADSARAAAPRAAAPRPKLDARLVAAIVVLVLAIGAAAVMRGGLLGLPPAPPGTTAESAGLVDLAALAARAGQLEPGRLAEGADPALSLAAEGAALLRGGQVAAGL